MISVNKFTSGEILAMNLKYYRYQLNMSQEKFAEMLGTTIPYINQLETNKRNPSLELIDRFAKCLNISSAELLTYNPKHHIEKIRIDEREK